MFIKQIPKIYNKRKQKCDESKNEMDIIEKNLNRDMSFMLNEAVSEKWKVFEKKYKEWDTKICMSWIKCIENGKFNDDKHSECIRKIEEVQINGDTMKELTGISLKLMGLNDGDRDILLKHINRVIYQFAALKNTTCTY